MRLSQKTNTVILGVGNLLFGDEGVGIHVIKELEDLKNRKKLKLNKGIKVVDGGTAGIDLLPIILSCKKLILIDAVDCGEKAGSIFKFSPDDICITSSNNHTLLKQDSKRSFISLHQVNIIDVLNVAKKLKKKIPEIVIFGIQPKHIDYSLELSQAVKKNVPKVIDLIIKEAGLTNLLNKSRK